MRTRDPSTWSQTSGNRTRQDIQYCTVVRLHIKCRKEGSCLGENGAALNVRNYYRRPRRPLPIPARSRESGRAMLFNVPPFLPLYQQYCFSCLPCCVLIVFWGSSSSVLQVTVRGITQSPLFAKTSLSRILGRFCVTVVSSPETNVERCYYSHTAATEQRLASNHSSGCYCFRCHITDK